MAVLEQSWVKVQEKTFGKWYGDAEKGICQTQMLNIVQAEQQAQSP